MELRQQGKRKRGRLKPHLADSQVVTADPIAVAKASILAGRPCKRQTPRGWTALSVPAFPLAVSPTCQLITSPLVPGILHREQIKWKSES